MPGWLSGNEALLIALLALFGAGGAGTLLVQHFLKGGGKASGGPAIHTKAQGGSTAVTHGGTGNVDVRVNETVSRDRFEEWRTRLGLSRTATTQLVRAIEAAKLAPERVEALSADLRDGAGGDWDALAEALERGDLPAARVELQSLDAWNRRGSRGT